MKESNNFWRRKEKVKLFTAINGAIRFDFKRKQQKLSFFRSFRLCRPCRKPLAMMREHRRQLAKATMHPLAWFRRRSHSTALPRSPHPNPVKDFHDKKIRAVVDKTGFKLYE